MGEYLSGWYIPGYMPLRVVNTRVYASQVGYTLGVPLRWVYTLGVPLGG